jgi:DME family drug/metabolite transporter
VHWPWRYIIGSAVCIAAYQLCFFLAVRLTGVSVGTVVAIGSAPLIGGLLGRIFLGEGLTLRWLGAVVMAVAGCALLVGGDVQVNLLGILLAAASGGGYALYSILSKEILRHHTPDAAAAITFFGAALLLVPLLPFLDLRWLADWRGVVAILWLGIVATALAYVLQPGAQRGACGNRHHVGADGAGSCYPAGGAGGRRTLDAHGLCRHPAGFVRAALPHRQCGAKDAAAYRPKSGPQNRVIFYGPLTWPGAAGSPLL